MKKANIGNYMTHLKDLFFNISNAYEIYPIFKSSFFKFDNMVGLKEISSICYSPEKCSMNIPDILDSESKPLVCMIDFLPNSLSIFRMNSLNLVYKKVKEKMCFTLRMSYILCLLHFI